MKNERDGEYVTFALAPPAYAAAFWGFLFSQYAGTFLVS